jgi:hypothetical protein
MKSTLVMLIIFFALMPGAAAEAGERQEQTDKPKAIHPLTEAQMQAIKTILDESKKKAAPVALRLGMTAKQVYENILSDKPDEATADKGSINQRFGQGADARTKATLEERDGEAGRARRLDGIDHSRFQRPRKVDALAREPRPPNSAFARMLE